MNMHKSPSANFAPTAMRVGQITAGKFLAVGALGLLLYVAHVAFVPIALALLCALVLSGPVEALYKLGVPRSVGATVILMIGLGIGASLMEVMWTPCQEWYAAAPQTIKLIKRRLTPAAKFITHVEELRSRASAMGTAAPPPAGAATLPAVVEQVSAPIAIVDATRGIVVSVLTFLIVTLFLLAGGPPMLARMTAAFVDDMNAAHVLHIIEKVRAEVGRFYVTTAMINVGLGFATAAAMFMSGMPTPYLLGVVAAILNFIPYAGPATTLVVLALVAALTFDNLNHVAAVAAAFLLLTFIEGQIVQPMLVGRRLKVNPLLIFVALWLGGLFWGIAGIILATPALVTLKVVAENAINGKSFMEFLGPNDQTPVVPLIGADKACEAERSV